MSEANNMSKFEMQTPPSMLEFRHTSVANEWVMRITADKRIEVNEDVEVTEAAKKVLQAMQHMLTPQQRKPLTDEKIMELWPFIVRRHEAQGFIKFARAIEAAHGIKE